MRKIMRKIRRVTNYSSSTEKHIFTKNYDEYEQKREQTSYIFPILLYLFCNILNFGSFFECINPKSRSELSVLILVVAWNHPFIVVETNKSKTTTSTKNEATTTTTAVTTVTTATTTTKAEAEAEAEAKSSYSYSYSYNNNNNNNKTQYTVYSEIANCFTQPATTNHNNSTQQQHPTTVKKKTATTTDNNSRFNSIEN
jgi:hypothetical protein